MSEVRTRFAPSPTGYLHVGGIRTALFAWLLARQAGGKFVLRLEDTDKKREVGGSDEHLMESLRALGLEYDEGPDIGGPFGPYRQSKRLDIYREWAHRLIDIGRAYADPYSPEQVQAFRDEAIKNKRPFLYRDNRPENPPVWDGNLPLRFKAEPKDYSWEDEVMGALSTGEEVIDDFILMKSDGYPTYNFAHIVDDAEMQISHIIRGQEFISSTPNYLNLYEALDLKRPTIATVPHILGPSGNKKLSKRDGAKDVLDYIKDGFMAESLVSFIATLGWNDGTEQEVFTKQELIKKFSLSRVQRSGARFDEDRLRWVNGHFIRNLSIDELYTRSEKFWPEIAQDFSEGYKKKVLSLIQERLKFLAEIPELTSFFFQEPEVNLKLIDNNKQLKKLSHRELADLLEVTLSSLEKSEFQTDDLTEKLNKLLETTGQKPGILFSLIRIATTWAPASPSLAESLSVIGKDKVVSRIKLSIKALA